MRLLAPLKDPAGLAVTPAHRNCRWQAVLLAERVALLPVVLVLMSVSVSVSMVLVVLLAERAVPGLAVAPLFQAWQLC